MVQYIPSLKNICFVWDSLRVKVRDILKRKAGENKPTLDLVLLSLLTSVFILRYTLSLTDIAFSKKIHLY